ncbi:hypothetical protein [Borreliella lusitaniae]|uniref:Uncharacterized protein n=1 Tax=Borreliella lusitaniae TaxID=100177 RepID=A0ABZ0CJA7_9SPIR|nr:hypothetical protein [Borreliella lusitaniae]WNY69096.1 hypothetical protein QIA44_04520 [Borreliella lusitaniae]
MFLSHAIRALALELEISIIVLLSKVARSSAEGSDPSLSTLRE